MLTTHVQFDGGSEVNMFKFLCNRFKSFLLLTNAWFNSTCYHLPPGHTPEDLQCFSHLAVYSPPLGTQKETIPHPRVSSATTNTLFCVQNIDDDMDFLTIAKPEVLTRIINAFPKFIEQRILHV